MLSALIIAFYDVFFFKYTLCAFRNVYAYLHDDDPYFGRYISSLRDH